MSKKILITGGAGFVGSHLADELLEHGYGVRVLDNLTRQVHPTGKRPDYLNDEVELMVGDIRAPATVHAALDQVDAVFHLAAAVGVGQSMYQIAHYTSVNCTGTALLLEAMLKAKVERLMVASSMSIYGERAYLRANGSNGSNGSNARDGLLLNGCERTLDQLRARKWDPIDSRGNPLYPAPTPESKLQGKNSLPAD